jgi:spore coat polysaccharide biosynthesis protein SpsF
MLNTAIIVQARAGSTRLPGKVLKELVDGKPMLLCLLERIKLSEICNEIVVATTSEPQDDAVSELAKHAGFECFRGSENDVLSRFAGAAARTGADAIVRICADSPLHDADIIDRCIQAYEPNKHDYVSNMHPETFPYGTAVEVFARDVLTRLDRLTIDQSLREHVTPMVYQRPELFVSQNVKNQRDLSQLRFTVDYNEDFDFVHQVYQLLATGVQGILFSWHSVIQLLDERPELMLLNASRNERLDRSKH